VRANTESGKNIREKIRTFFRERESLINLNRILINDECIAKN
jgi:hypothetical protein